jgi:hypothetical protein
MIVADALLIAGEAKTPAKNLQMINEAADCAKPAPSVNSAKIGVVTKKTALRPNVSDNGAPMGGLAFVLAWYQIGRGNFVGKLSRNHRHDLGENLPKCETEIVERQW